MANQHTGKFVQPGNTRGFAACSLQSLLLALGVVTGCSVWASATDNTDEQDQQIEEIVVTGMRVTAGGAQDVNFSRSEILAQRVPHPNTFTSEGLFSQHDLTIQSKVPCSQLFCLTAQAMPFTPLTKPQDTHLVGLGFATNIEARQWQRQPVNLVAVVDKSGSMSGHPLNLVRHGLQRLVGELRTGDQLSVVLYGDRSHVYVAPTPINNNSKAMLVSQINRIASQGSTNMEEGLAVGYEVAAGSAPAFAGTTRLVLFTDERPNVGATHAASFIGMAKAASLQGVGLTTIGVGVQFDAELATKVASTRGGNLFFVGDFQQADQLFGDELDMMVSELAHDLNLTLTPHPGYQISGVYGVPKLLTSRGQNEAVNFTIPSVFLSKRGGGVFVTLAPTDAYADLPPPGLASSRQLLQGRLSYVAARTNQPATDTLAVQLSRQPAAPASDSLRLASLLLDEYLLLTAATRAHHVHNDQQLAFRHMRKLQHRIEAFQQLSTNQDDLQGVARELSLTNDLTQLFAELSGYVGEHGFRPLAAEGLVGDWRVERIRGKASALSPAAAATEVGGTWTFTDEGQLILGTAARHGLPYRATKRHLLLGDLTGQPTKARYNRRGRQLTLQVPAGRGRTATVWLIKESG